MNDKLEKTSHNLQSAPLPSRPFRSCRSIPNIDDVTELHPSDAKVSEEDEPDASAGIDNALKVQSPRPACDIDGQDPLIASPVTRDRIYNRNFLDYFRNRIFHRIFNRFFHRVQL
jgi:hypothetical protein